MPTESKLKSKTNSGGLTNRTTKLNRNNIFFVINGLYLFIFFYSEANFILIYIREPPTAWLNLISVTPFFNLDDV